MGTSSSVRGNKMEEVRFDKGADMFETWENGRLRCEQFGDRMTWKERLVLQR